MNPLLKIDASAPAVLPHLLTDRAGDARRLGRALRAAHGARVHDPLRRQRAREAPVGAEPWGERREIGDRGDHAHQRHARVGLRVEVESAEGVERRVGDHRLARLLAADDWDTVLLVLHGGVNRGILSWFLTGQPVFLGGLAQDPACLNVIDVGPTVATSIVRVVNFCALDTLQTTSRLSTMEHLLGQYMKLRATRGTGGTT